MLRPTSQVLTRRGRIFGAGLVPPLLFSLILLMPSALAQDAAQPVPPPEKAQSEGTQTQNPPAKDEGKAAESDRKKPGETTLEKMPTADAPAQKTPDVPAEKTSDAPAEKAPDKPAEKTSDAPAEKAPDKPAEKTTETPAEKAPDKPAEKTTETPAEMAPDKPAEKTSDAPTEKAPDKPTEKTTEAPAEMAPDKPAEKTTEAPAEKAPDKPTEKATEAPAEKATEAPAEKKDETKGDDKAADKQDEIKKDGTKKAVETIPGMPPVIDPANIYSEAVVGRLSTAVAGALPRIYVPNVAASTVYVIDPATMKVVERFNVGLHPQHIVPSWDLKTLWVTSNAERNPNGSVTPIDPMTGKPGNRIPVDDPYNMYFTADGSFAVVVAEAHRRLDFRDPHTMALQFSLPTPQCSGINHADFSIDGKYALFTCEFGGAIVKVDMVAHAVIGYLKLSKGGMPQDIRVGPDGKVFYVADMMADGVFLIDGDTLAEIGFIETGPGTHGLYPSRDATKLYVSNRGSHHVHGERRGPGSVSVIDFKTRKVEANWPIPGGGSPDMGNVSADGSQLWLSGRFDNVVYCIDTKTGEVKVIPVGHEPHGLAVWPQPGRYSLGHTGIMR